MNKNPFTFSGIADEAGKEIGAQIRAHQELGWRFIELRLVNSAQITDIPESDFDDVCAALSAADLQVSGFASGIGNWACKITDPFEYSISTLQRAITRMKRLNTKFIRVMSYPNDGLSADAWRDEAVRRLKILGQMAQENDITLLVENCDGWASESPENYRQFFELVDSPAVKTVYDTGNPASHGHTNTWDWYQAAKPHIAYVHIKAHSGPNGVHTWPDSGESCVAETLRDLLSSGYNGFVSIEPHIQSIIHERQSINNEEAAFQSYIEYGQRLMRLVDEVRATTP